MDYNPVGWFEIYVQDMKRARAFYEHVFQCSLDNPSNLDIEMWMFPILEEAKGAPGALVHMPGFQSGGNSTLVYFTCLDCAEEAARVVEAGGKIFRDKMAIGDYGFIVLALDTEGNMIGLHSHQ